MIIEKLKKLCVLFLGYLGTKYAHFRKFWSKIKPKILLDQNQKFIYFHRTKKYLSLFFFEKKSHFVGYWCCKVSFECMQHKTLKKQFVDKLTATVDPHACKMYVLKPVAWVLKTRKDCSFWSCILLKYFPFFFGKKKKNEFSTPINILHQFVLIEEYMQPYLVYELNSNE